MKLVRDAMQREPRWCFDDEPMEKAVARMHAAQLKVMPVVDRTLRLVGMLSIDEVADRATAIAAPGVDDAACEQRKESS